MLPLIGFLIDPTGETAAFAVGATATAASLFGSELGKNIAGMVNPMLHFYAGINVFKALTFDADYYRSQGFVTYKKQSGKPPVFKEPMAVKATGLKVKQQ